MHYSRTKIIAILSSVVLALILCVPNILPANQQEYLEDNFGLRPMTLGLDLQGGSNIVLEIDRQDLTEKLLLQLAGDIRPALREAKIGYSGLQRTATGASVRITKPEDMAAAKLALENLLQPVQSGLFAQSSSTLYSLTANAGGYSLDISEAGLAAKIAISIQQSLKIVENRINGTGVTEATVQQQGSDRIVVQLPGVKDPEQILDLLGRTAKLTFQLLCEDQPTAENQNPPQECRGYPRKEDVDAMLESKKKKGETVVGDDYKKLPQIWVKTAGRDTIDGADLNDAQASFDQNNRPVVTFRFNNKGSVRFGKLTAENVNKPFAIILDDVIQSYPTINEPILGGSGQISGNFTTEETGNLAIVLRSGALPAKLNIVQQNTVGPSLGSDSIKAGVTASLVGLVGVMIFIMLPYGFFGFVANAALLVNLLMLIAIMSFFGFTLTLPGIAGIVLTLGMSVDSNVLIYERIREEWRNGRTALNAIETGFKQALATVVDANVTTLIAAVVLFGVGSGPIRGFAITLFVGILTTMFTAFTLTRMIVSLWVRRYRPKEINL